MSPWVTPSISVASHNESVRMHRSERKLKNVPSFPARFQSSCLLSIMCSGNGRTSLSPSCARLSCGEDEFQAMRPAGTLPVRSSIQSAELLYFLVQFHVGVFLNVNSRTKPLFYCDKYINKDYGSH